MSKFFLIIAIGQTVPHVIFTDNIQRHVKCPPAEAQGETVREVLKAYFAEIPSAKRYVLDDQGSLRKHMVIFVNSQQIADRTELSDPVPNDGTVEIIQALSGG